jgi:M6 family metalloprotease-like protein
MNKIIISAFSWALLLACAGSPQHAYAAGPTLSDFGYRKMTSNGKLASGPRPLLVIMAQFSDEGGFTHTPAQIQQLVFGGKAGQPNLAAWGRSNSNGRFTWVPAQSLPIYLGPAVLGAQKNLSESALRRLVLQKAIDSGFKIRSFDRNRDGHVTSDELGVLIIHTIADLAQTEPTFCLNDRSLCPSVTEVAEQHDLATWTHETTHQLGATDAYGVWNINRAFPDKTVTSECLNQHLTLMGCTENGNINTYQLDPWHKMELGWSEPRIVPFSSYGHALLPAADRNDPAAPLILYDPRRDASEYFILEFRNNHYRGASGYDANIPQNGVGIWHVKLAPGNSGQLAQVQALGTYDPSWPGDKESALFLDGPPLNIRGQSNLLWGSGHSGRLKWLDGTDTGFDVRVDDYTVDENQVTVYWGDPRDVIPPAPPPNNCKVSALQCGTGVIIGCPETVDHTVALELRTGENWTQVAVNPYNAPNKFEPSLPDYSVKNADTASYRVCSVAMGGYACGAVINTRLEQQACPPPPVSSGGPSLPPCLHCVPKVLPQ